MNTAIRMTKQEIKEQEKRKQKRWTLIAILLLLVAALGFIIYMANYPTTQAAHMVAGDIFPGAGTAEEGNLPGMTEDEIKAQMQREVDETMFSFKVNAQPVFEDGSGEGTLRIENPSHNVYPFVVEIFLDETGEKVYDSGGVLPNHHIETAKLTTALAGGTYKATAYINAYDPDTNEFQGKSAVSMELVIQN
ncbi:hypothetical protein LJC56_06690 [Christensenellaceae bacterium OttesenSCG-928-K19]|nr:hypothetical protein [Christensenellaceae bacterium OttesenSCG-928-K19]